MARVSSAFCALLITFSSLIHADINWLTDYDQAVERSVNADKTLLVLFTGSDWCGWCKRLEEEVFANKEFCQQVCDQFVFLKIDFPLSAQQNREVRERNRALQEQFHVEGFPTIVLLDEKQQKIGTAGYQEGGGKQYADYLIRIVHDYAVYRDQLGRLQSQRLTSKTLQQLYAKASELGQKDDIDAIIAAGVMSDNPTPFLIERYRFLAESRQADSEEAKTIRKHLQESDPLNEQGTHYRLAIIDYQQKAERLEDGVGTAEEACAPLIEYLDMYGVQDPANRWRLNMTISQTFHSQGEFGQALQFARASLDTAPRQFRDDIASTIKVMEESMPQEATASLELDGFDGFEALPSGGA